ncbi:MAG: hypothetical protein IRY95_10825, partial [Clostridia bacterium]|nr:hypothetical protein [Clostridia bacterium]
MAAPLERSCKAIASAAAAILAAASLADCLLLAAALSRAPLLAAGTLNTAVWLVTGSTAGILTMFRAVLATGILACTPWRPGHRLRNAGVVVLGASLLVTFSLTGHAAATPDNRVWPVLADLVHLLAAAAWYGGLCLFALLPWRNLQGGLGVAVLAAITNRFSNLGIAAMALVAVTGVYMAALRLYGVLALVEHRYGLT